MTKMSRSRKVSHFPPTLVAGVVNPGMCRTMYQKGEESALGGPCWHSSRSILTVAFFSIWYYDELPGPVGACGTCCVIFIEPWRMRYQCQHAISQMILFCVAKLQDEMHTCATDEYIHLMSSCATLKYVSTCYGQTASVEQTGMHTSLDHTQELQGYQPSTPTSCWLVMIRLMVETCCCQIVVGGHTHR